MLIYNYNAETGKYLSESIARQDPLEEGKFLIPAGATVKMPLEAKDGFDIYFINGAWEYVEIISDDTQEKLSEIEAKLKEINNEYEKGILGLTENTPSSEISTWTKQESEARAYVTDNTVETPLIDSISTSREMSKDILVAKIIEKANAYAVAVGQLIGARQKAEDEIKDDVVTA